MVASPASLPRPRCPGCGRVATPADDRFVLEGVPTREGSLPASREEALACPRGRIRMVECPACSAVWNAAFDATLVGFDASYDINLTHSGVYDDYVRAEAARLVETYGLHGPDKVVVEVACGKGDFLRLVTDAGGCRGVGFDPTCRPVKDGRVRLCDAWFSDAAVAGLGPVDAVVCRSALQYFDDVAPFLRAAASAVAPRNGVVYVEVPDGGHAFDPAKLGNVWNLAYEHATWYRASALASALRTAGLKPVLVRQAFGDGQNLVVDAVPGAQATAVETTPIDWQMFTRRQDRAVAGWTRRLAGAGRSVVWGAGARSISLLTRCDPHAEHVSALVDINPNRQGRFLPLTGHPVLAPDALPDLRPDVVFVSNANYAGEIIPEVARRLPGVGVVAVDDTGD